MRFLTNENFPLAAVEALRDIGHDVAWVRTDAPGISDADVLAWAARDVCILLTFDKDFGELARRARLPAGCGVVLFRMPMPPAKAAGVRLVAMLAARPDWPGHFSVIEPGRVRMRRLANEREA